MHVTSAGQIEDERAQEYCQIWALHIRQRIHNASIKEFHFSEGIGKRKEEENRCCEKRKVKQVSDWPSLVNNLTLKKNVFFIKRINKTSSKEPDLSTAKFASSNWHAFTIRRAVFSCYLSSTALHLVSSHLAIVSVAATSKRKKYLPTSNNFCSNWYFQGLFFLTFILKPS